MIYEGLMCNFKLYLLTKIRYLINSTKILDSVNKIIVMQKYSYDYLL